MLDWLRRDARSAPTVAVAGRELPVEIRRHAQARRLTMRLAPDGGAVRITMPTWGRTADALAFAEMRRDWLARQIAAIPETVAATPHTAIPFRGDMLNIEHDPRARRAPAAMDGVIRLGGPVDGVPQRLQRWLEQEARGLMDADLAHYCQRLGRAPARLQLSRAQRRWGSCSASGVIRINWRLVMAPDAIRRSVVAHEVAHLAHFDHGPRFHALLADLFEGDLPAADRWLKAEGRALYRWFG